MSNIAVFFAGGVSSRMNAIIHRPDRNIMEDELNCFPYGNTPLILVCLMNGYYIDEELSCYRWQSIGSWSEKMQILLVSK